MYISDCRKDKTYNYENLSEKDKEFVDGYDYCIENSINSFWYNLDVYLNCDSYLNLMLNDEMPEIMQSENCKTWCDFLKAALEDWVEKDRDEIITSIIDHYPEEIEG